MTPSYFQAIGTPILQGRSFEVGEDSSKPPFVAIVSETVARNMYGSTAQALGRTFKFSEDSVPTQIVGVVADGRYRGLNQATGDIFVSYEQSNLPERYLVVRSRNNPSAMSAIVRHAISQIDGTQADSREATMTELVDRALSQDRFYGELLLFFAAGALLLAAIGVYGVVSDMVVMRTKEFGIRVVLGAQPGAIGERGIAIYFELGCAGRNCGRAGGNSCRIFDAREIIWSQRDGWPFHLGQFGAADSCVAGCVCGAGFASDEIGSESDFEGINARLARATTPSRTYPCGWAADRERW